MDASTKLAVGSHQPAVNTLAAKVNEQGQSSENQRGMHQGKQEVEIAAYKMLSEQVFSLQEALTRVSATLAAFGDAQLNDTMRSAHIKQIEDTGHVNRWPISDCRTGEAKAPDLVGSEDRRSSGNYTDLNATAAIPTAGTHSMPSAETREHYHSNVTRSPVNPDIPFDQQGWGHKVSSHHSRNTSRQSIDAAANPSPLKARRSGSEASGTWSIV